MAKQWIGTSKLKPGEVLEINVPSGTKYISEWMEELPFNCILDKGATGCGGTTLAFQTKSRVIWATPYVSLIKNKAEQDDKVFAFCGNVSKEEFLYYISSHSNYKIGVTYDSLPKLLEWMDDEELYVYQMNPYDAHLLIDEYHTMLTSYSFRHEAISELLEIAEQFDAVTYMSATPIEEQYLFGHMKTMPIVKLIWDNNDIVKTKVNSKHVSSTRAATLELMKAHVQDNSFGNLHIFVNSVSFICSIIKHMGLTEDTTRVFCSKNNSKARLSLKSLGFNINEYTDPVKQINFYTSTSFEGCDIYDPEGKIVVICDSRDSVIPIDTLLVQICGRIRNSVYNGEILQLFTTTHAQKHHIDWDAFDMYIQEERAKTLQFIKDLNGLGESKESIMSALAPYLNAHKIRQLTDGTIELDEGAFNAQIINYKLRNQIYSSATVMQEELKNANFDVIASAFQKYEKPSDKAKASSSRRISFKDAFTEYVALKETTMQYSLNTNHQRVLALEEWEPLLKEAYTVLGAERVKELKYKKYRIEQELIALKDESPDWKISQLVKLTHFAFYSSSELKQIIQKAYDALSLKRTAKATDIFKWYEGDNKTMRDGGKVIKGIYIKRPKFIRQGLW